MEITFKEILVIAVVMFAILVVIRGEKEENHPRGKSSRDIHVDINKENKEQN